MKVAALALAMVTTSGLAMMDPAPPIKMGLWMTTESTTTILPPGMQPSMKQAGIESGVPITQKMKACYTPDLWDRAMGIKPISDKCSVAKRSLTAQGATLTETCTIGTVTLISDITLTFDSPELWHGSGHTKTIYPPTVMGGGTSTSETTFKATYAGASCGDVAPGKTVTIP